MSKIRVLSVDDSALMRQLMTEIVNSHSDMEMVGDRAGSAGGARYDQKV
ncbi:Chemotaxis response regulator protein-glutamate methylesterase [Serratia plymuthica]|uniref:Chemotaxis response regulator protein-glutamate methylesterase n=1 Tax=Serratia plymuthica TaxID=82996 RepID=A0A2X4UW48_SERPL|nr:Chemotaxis response regulator protein-glutamate methylesterase [Serratia plymuthica]